MEEAIRTMMVRGAPAIGIAAAYALVLAASRGRDTLRAAAEALGKARPTAVNLSHAIATMMRAAEQDPEQHSLGRVARAYHKADVDACKRIGALGAEVLPAGCTVLTHCNAGALATGGYGTALGVVRAARSRRKGRARRRVRDAPAPSGGAPHGVELARDGIPITLITDSMAASLMAAGEIGAVVVGADRIARNGDVANKIGTYGLACLAHAHDVPFYVAAPWSTVDLACESGAAIPIEQRSEEEVVIARGDAHRPRGRRRAKPRFRRHPRAPHPGDLHGARRSPTYRAQGMIATSKPAWLKVRAPGGETYTHLKETFRKLDLHTVCEEARCPNVGECWTEGTATVMLLGDTCTRGCRFCAVTTGNPRGAVDGREPEHVARGFAGPA